MKIFLLDVAHGLTGTFPSSEQDSQTPDWSATGATTLRRADMAPGAVPASLAGNTAATTSAQAGFMGFWALPPLSGAQTVGGGAETITVNVAIKESSLSANLLIACHAYVWRPSSGTLVGDLCSFATAAIDAPAEPTAADSIQVCIASFGLASVSAVNGDVPIIEIWAKQTQDAASSYTATLYYGGATDSAVEGTVVSSVDGYAASIEFSQALTFQQTTANASAINVEALISGNTVTANASALSVEALVSGNTVTANASALSVEALVSGDVVTANASAIWIEVLYEVYIPIALDGSATIDAKATGDLGAQIHLAGDSDIDINASIANVTAKINLEGDANVTISLGGDLNAAASIARFASALLSAKVDIDLEPSAAKNFYREVRLFAERTKPWQEANFYEVQPDERWDMSLVSRRVYGRRDEYLAVLAAAGLDMYDQGLTQRRLVLPTERQLNAIKRRTGFESIADLREEFQPVWVEKAL